MNERQVVVTSAVRSPVGSFLGVFKDISVNVLGGVVIREAIRRAGIEDACVDEVIMGCCGLNEPGGNPAREALLAAGLPFEIPAYTVNKNCASSLKSVAVASAMIRYGEADVVVAGGMENMSRYPYALKNARTGYRLGHGQLVDTLMEGLDGMGLTAERLAEKYGISRREQDEFAYASQMKAARAQQEGRFVEQIVPVSVPQRKGEPVLVSRDEAGRPDTTLEKLAALKPVFKEDGTVTAGNSSTINDAAAALVLMSAGKASELGVKPLAEVRAWASAGCDPKIMGIGPVPATKRLLRATRMDLSDFDLVEINEAFAAQTLAVLRELPVDRERLNVNGGAIALGHPTGATGAILIVRLIYEMKRRSVENGLVTMCVGGGQGMALAIRNLP